MGRKKWILNIIYSILIFCFGKKIPQQWNSFCNVTRLLIWIFFSENFVKMIFSSMRFLFSFSVHYLNVWYCPFRISWKIGKNPQFNSTKTTPKSTKNYGQTSKRNPKLYNELIRNKRNRNLAMNRRRYLWTTFNFICPDLSRN